jgi:hypothetical protein
VNDWSTVLIPLIRKVVPSVIAQDIVGVQPMSGLTGQIFGANTKAYTIVKSSSELAGHMVIDVNHDVSQWIQTMPIHLWKFDNNNDDVGWLSDRYIISEELYTFLVLKWT